ncbi:hypothetical protein AYO41_01020 [Verrucomicrobia bacterium SCGC AG-212-E04]|nr:hypothetical protein AYO41_01020 [Verrucomicrobia bacterium SCGC AG-212-E04]
MLPRLPYLLAAVLALAACKPQPAETQESAVVRFVGSGFTLEPGPEWIRLNTRAITKPLSQVICQPALTTKGTTIQVAQLGDRISETDAIGQVRKAFEADELARKDTMVQSDFQADSGVRGKRVRYTRHTAPDPARILNYLTQYVVRNAGGRWISVGVLADTVEQTDAADAMVQRTLRDAPQATPTPRAP